MLALVALATVLVPLLVGAALADVARHALGRRTESVVAALLALVLPPVAAAACTAWHPVLGLWDAVAEGLLVGVGFVAGAHRRLATRDRLVTLAGGIVVGLLLLEIGARLFLPPPPRFPTWAGVHFFLDDAIRASTFHQAWDFRSRELACTVVYGGQYRGMLETGGDPETRFPSRYVPRAGAARRELHVGDSLVFGLGVARHQTFTAALETLEPTTEHVNAGIPGLAPDAYLAVLETWIERQRFDAVTMYLYEGNDIRDLDGPYPCCDFAPLLTYDDPAPHLRCAIPTPFDVGAAGFEWIRYNSPPPYLLRILVDRSVAAAHLAGALISVGQASSLTSTATEPQRWSHLAAILTAARDELARRGIAFRVVLFPSDPEPSGAEPPQHALLLALVGRLGIPFLDATPLLRTATAEHRDIFLRPLDPHFNRAGHELVAEWIHASWQHVDQAAAR
jgi:hypothetical protein